MVGREFLQYEGEGLIEIPVDPDRRNTYLEVHILPSLNFAVNTVVKASRALIRIGGNRASPTLIWKVENNCLAVPVLPEHISRAMGTTKSWDSAITCQRQREWCLRLTNFSRQRTSAHIVSRSIAILM